MVWIVNLGQLVRLLLTQLAVCLEPESELKYMDASSLYLMSTLLPVLLSSPLPVCYRLTLHSGLGYFLVLQ